MMRQLQKYGGVNRARCVIRLKHIRARKGAPYENRTRAHAIVDRLRWIMRTIGLIVNGQLNAERTIQP